MFILVVIFTVCYKHIKLHSCLAATQEIVPAMTSSQCWNLVGTRFNMLGWLKHQNEMRNQMLLDGAWYPSLVLILLFYDCRLQCRPTKLPFHYYYKPVFIHQAKDKSNVMSMCDWLCGNIVNNVPKCKLQWNLKYVY